MKNEGPFILEWVAHYKALGFDNIVVCTNDCEDTTVEILKNLEEKGVVRHHPTIIRGGGIQRSAFRQARKLPEIKDADWVFVNDVGEFLNIHIGDGSMRALVELSGNNLDMISIPWRTFGPKNVFTYHDRPLKQQFNFAEVDCAVNPQAGRFIKTLFINPKIYQRIGPGRFTSTNSAFPTASIVGMHMFLFCVCSLLLLFVRFITLIFHEH